jgi:hypothetical protein
LNERGNDIPSYLLGARSTVVRVLEANESSFLRQALVCNLQQSLEVEEGDVTENREEAAERTATTAYRATTVSQKSLTRK